MYFHHNKAFSYTANLTTEYLVKMKSGLGISFIKNEIPVKTPDGSSLDFFGFAYLKIETFVQKDNSFGWYLETFSIGMIENRYRSIQRVFNS